MPPVSGSKLSYMFPNTGKNKTKASPRILNSVSSPAIKIVKKIKKRKALYLTEDAKDT